MPTTRERLVSLLRPDMKPADSGADPGFLDLLSESPQAGRPTGLAQRLMRTSDAEVRALDVPAFFH